MSLQGPDFWFPFQQDSQGLWGKIAIARYAL